MGAYEIIKIKSQEEFFCDVDCDPGNGKRYASHRLEIIDYPAAHLCKRCVNEFEKLWESAINKGVSVGA